MEVITQQQFKDAFDKAPESLKLAVLSNANFKVLKDIHAANGLTQEQAVVVAEETGNVLVGLRHPSKLIATLTERTKLPEGKSRAIAQAINENIFRPVREDLMKQYGIQNASQVPSSKPPLPPNAQTSGATQTIGKQGATVPAPSSVPTPPKPKPIDAELQENVGLRKQLEAAKAAEKQTPLSKALEDALRNKNIPPASSPKPDMSATIPKAPEPGIEELTNMPRMAPPPPKPSASVTPPVPPRPTQPWTTAPRYVPPAPPAAPQPQTPAPKPPAVPRPYMQTPNRSPLPAERAPAGNFASRAAQTPPAEPDEENLSREDILKAIEDPSNITEPPAMRSKDSVTPPASGRYDVDPYREPLG